MSPCSVWARFNEQNRGCRRCGRKSYFWSLWFRTLHAKAL